MWYFLAALIGLLIGAGAVWYWQVPKVQKEMIDWKRKWLDLKNAAEAVYSNEFGGYGIRPEMLTEAYNRMWRALGKDEKGRPPR